MTTHPHNQRRNRWRQSAHNNYGYEVRGFEVIDKRDFEKRFSNLRNILVVTFGDEFSKIRNSRSLKYYYILSVSLPFVFEVPTHAYYEDMDHEYVSETIAYLGRLRRIRIIQSLKSGDVIFSGIIDRRGEILEKGGLELTFIHPLMNLKLLSCKFSVSFQKNDQGGIYGFVQLDKDSRNDQVIYFPENCCVVSLMLSRKGNNRSFSCLVWLMEKKYKGKKAYFCTIKVDMQTKINLFFVPLGDFGHDPPRNPSTMNNNNMVLALCMIEISIGSNPIYHDHHQNEFIASIKRSKLDESEDNYRFNIENWEERPINNNIQQAPELEEHIPGPMNAYIEVPGNGETQHQENKLKSLPDKVEKENADLPINLNRTENMAKRTNSGFILGKNLASSDNRISRSVPPTVIFSAQAILDNCLDRIKCLELQSVVKMMDPVLDHKTINMLLQSILPNLVIIARGVYGNFLVQILISKLSAVQRKQLMITSSKQIAMMCLDKKGIFCAQMLVDHLDQHEDFELFFEILENHIDSLIRDDQACFVLKKTVQNFPLEYIHRMLKLISKNFVEYASDKYGICVIKFIIKRYEKDYGLFSHIVKEFCMHVPKGKLNSHFNFGLQHLIEVANQKYWNLKDLNEIMICFFSLDVKCRIRSKALVQTIKLIYNYHNHEFVSNSIKPLVLRHFDAPLTHNEAELLKAAQMKWPKLQMIKSEPYNKSN